MHANSILAATTRKPVRHGRGLIHCYEVRNAERDFTVCCYPCKPSRVKAVDVLNVYAAANGLTLRTAQLDTDAGMLAVGTVTHPLAQAGERYYLVGMAAYSREER